MKSIIHFSLILAIFALARQCGKEDFPSGTPACVKQKIGEISRADVRNPPAKVYSYQFEGQTVYYVPSYCCDFPSELYDEKCNLICLPDGGFTGKGDGKCADFLSNRTGEKLIWEDKRE